MSNLGMGVMLHMLAGGTKNSADKYYGRKITAAALDDNKLALTFEDGVTIRVFDDGQSCCENRFMSTDDDVQWLVGKTLTALTIKEGETKDEDYEVKESQFLEVMTNEGCITFANHVEHNGYYGGFGMTITEDGKDD